MKIEIANGRVRFYQWDSDQQLIIHDDGLCSEVHFADPERKQALVCRILDNDGLRVVSVPNVLLQRSGSLPVYLYCRNESGSETCFSKHFQILERPKPDDYVYTETEVLSYACLERRITELEKMDSINPEAVEESIRQYMADHPITPEGIGAVPAEQLTDAIEDALAQAKVSGEFKGEPGETGAKGDPGATGKDGVSATHSWDGTVLRITSASGTSSAELKGEKGDQGEKGDKGLQGEKGDKGDKGDTGATGATGPAGADGKDGEDYVLTASDKAEIAEMVENATIVQAPKYVNSVEEMTDTNRTYVLVSTGHIWVYMNTTTEQEVTVTDQIVDTTDNPYEDNKRLGSSGAISSATGYSVTPYIDLTKAEYQGKTIELHLEGNRYVSETGENYIMTRYYGTDRTTLLLDRGSTTLTSGYALDYIVDMDGVIHSETSATLTIPIPAKNSSGVIVGYARFCGLGLKDTANVYITYKTMQTVTGGQWVDTGTTYAPTLTAEEKAEIAEDVAELVDAQLLTIIGDGVVTV